MLKFPSIDKGGLNIPKLHDMNEFSTESRFTQLSWPEYVTMIFIFQFGNLYTLTAFLRYNMLYGGVLYTSVYILIYLFIGMPLNSLHLFLGHFSKCGFFRLWNLCPVFKGVGYSTLLFGLTGMIYNSVLVGTFLLYIVSMVKSKMIWTTCSFEGADNSTCLEYKSLIPFNSTDVCCPYVDASPCVNTTSFTPTIEFSSLQYYRNVITKHSQASELLSHVGPIKKDLAGCVTLVWIISALAATLGFHSTKNIIRRAGLYSIMFLLICFVVSVVQAVPQGDKVIVGSQVELFGETSTVLMLFINVCAKALPAQIVCMGAYGPDHTMPTVDSLLVSVMFLVMLFIFAVWLTVDVGSIRFLINLKSVHCITYLGVEVLIALLPDFIFKNLPISIVFVYLYYISFIILGLCVQIIYVTTVLDALEDNNYKFHHYRLQFCILVCVICNAIALASTTPLHQIVMESWDRTGNAFCIVVIMTFFAVSTMWIYGTQRIQSDIEFKYKTKFSITFWLTCWKCLPFTTITVLILSIINLKKTYGSVTNILRINYIMVVATIIILAPIPFAAIYYYFTTAKQTKNKFATMFKSDVGWGPPDAEFRRHRNRFNPKKEIRYKSGKAQCRHNCLLYSKSLAHEIDRLEGNRKVFIEEMRKISEQEAAEVVTSAVAQ